MKLYLDSADMGALRPLMRTGLFAGVTTNPLILSRAGLDQTHVRGLVTELFAAGAGQVFVQTVTDGVEELVREGREIAALGERVVAKIPATRDGFAAARRLADDDVPVLITAVYHARQALLARAAGAWGIAPYVGRMSDAGRDGLAQVAAMQQLLDGTGVRVLAASIRSADVVCELAALGIHSVTVSTTVADELFEDELTARAVAEFAAISRG
ncbi:transaldolase family protein [Georgenia sunbinii]|uniref:transaldolase family protein n=1 Tax=Georgenia sunbinii TaxID=3117728 RepID=UPI002F26D558